MEFSESPAKHLCKRLSMFLLSILAAYLLLLALVRVFERRMIFFLDYPGYIFTVTHVIQGSCWRKEFLWERCYPEGYDFLRKLT